MRSSSTITALIWAGAAAASSIAAQPHSGQHLGEVHFQTSCNAAAQAHFDRGMRYQHSFWYRESKASFEEAFRADRECAIAYRGIAQSLLANPFDPTPAKNLLEGRAAIQKATWLGTGTARENDLIWAIGVFYTDFETLNQRTRAVGYTKRWKRSPAGTRTTTRCRPITRWPST